MLRLPENNRFGTTILRLSRHKLFIMSLVSCVFVLSCVRVIPAWGYIDYTGNQREAIVEMLEQLEERHYSKQAYDDTLSSEHLDSYIDSLDGSKMFFTAADIAEFDQFRTVMDDQLRKGKLDAGFAIFNRYYNRLTERLETMIKTLPEAVASMDFTVEESFSLDVKSRDWARDEAELDDRWRKQLKNQVLGLRLANKPEGEIVPTLMCSRFTPMRLPSCTILTPITCLPAAPRTSISI